MYKYFLLLLLAGTTLPDQRPTLYIIGDSTVKNGKGRGDGGLWGWGNFLGDSFDTTRLAVRNYALGGRSSRTFITEDHWEQVRSQLKPGDYVIMQFGHNDGGPLDDTARARGTIKGGDHTHTNEAGARLNAAAVVTGLRGLKVLPVTQYLRP